MNNVRIGREIYKCMYNFDESCNYLVAFEEYGEKYVIPCQNYFEFAESLNEVYSNNKAKLVECYVKYDEKWEIIDEWWDYLG